LIGVFVRLHFNAKEYFHRFLMSMKVLVGEEDVAFNPGQNTEILNII